MTAGSTRGLLARMMIAAAAFALLALVAARTVRIETDFAAFLPPSSTPAERLLLSQLREGLVSRLMLVSLAGAEPARLAAASEALSAALDGHAAFAYAANGSVAQRDRLAAILFANRYRLSPEVTPGRFEVPALREAIAAREAELASPFGTLARPFVARDPTGELLSLLKVLDGAAAPPSREGVWMSEDGQRAFLLLQTRAAGFDSEAQAAAMDAVRRAAAAAAPGVDVVLTGPGVFAAESRTRIRGDAQLLSTLSTLIVVAMLWFVYRSLPVVLLVMVPVAFGLTAGVLLVDAWFGAVHAITLGFAATLIGEAVDYPSYLLLNTAPNESVAASSRRIGRTLALAALSTVVSALALTLSSFNGLAQLGVLTMSGVLAAGLITRYGLPWILGDAPLEFRRPAVPAMPAWLARGAVPAAAALAVVLAASWLAATHPAWWERDLAGLSPVPQALRERDAALRREMGAPEVSLLVVSRGGSEAAALEAAGRLLPSLAAWKAQGVLRSFDSPALYLPGPATQAARVAALPPRAVLARNVAAAQAGSAFREGAFTPFLDEVDEARAAAPVTRATYAGTPLGERLAALVVEQDGQWLALTPVGGVVDPARLAAAVKVADGGASELVNLTAVSAAMVDGFRKEALGQAGLGAVLIFALMYAGLRSPRRALAVALPPLAAVAATAALLVAAGQRLSVFHLVAMLLVLGIGLNYALFFEDAPAEGEARARTRLALAVCSTATIVTFGFLALSSTPVLRAIGSTVALGTALALLMSAWWARPRTAA